MSRLAAQTKRTEQTGQIKPPELSGRAPAAAPLAARALDWDDLRYFLAVVAAGSLSAAARALHVNTTTVLRRIAALERALEARLFARQRSGYHLTADGARLLESLEPVDKHLSSLARDFRARQRDRKGVVRLGLGETLVQTLLAPAAARLAAQAPDILLELVPDSSLKGPARAPRVLTPLRDLDLALRLARPMSGDMLMRKLGDMGYGLYAAPRLAAAYRGTLSGQPVIGFGEGEEPLGPVWWLERQTRAANLIVRSSSVSARLAAACAGLGYAVLPCCIGDARRDLVRLTQNAQPGALEIWLLARTDMARLAHVRAVMDVLIAESAAAAERLRGAPLLADG